MSQLFKKRVLQTLSDIKHEKFSYHLPEKIAIYDNQGKHIGWLSPLTLSDKEDKQIIQLLATWRKENIFAFSGQFIVTFEGTKKWLQKALLHNPTRILFFVETLKHERIGHIGLYSFNFRNNSCEIDNVVRGVKDLSKGIMTHALQSLIQWTQCSLQPNHIFLRVFHDNKRAIVFYKRSGFIEYERIPLEKKQYKHEARWEENSKLQQAEKYFIKMKYDPNYKK